MSSKFFIVKEDVEKIFDNVGQKTKSVTLLSGSWDGDYAVAAVVIDDLKPKAEIHKKAVDIWHIIKGRGKFILGGDLRNVDESVSDTELVSDSLLGGNDYEVKSGDIIDIPAGLAHQIDARGQRLEMIIVKVKRS